MFKLGVRERFGKPFSQEQSSLGEQVRRAIRSGRRVRYWPVVAVLAGLGVLSLFVPGARRAGGLLSEPSSPRPEFTVLREEDISLGRVERRSVAVLVSPQTEDSGLQSILDWALYEILAELNGRQGKHLQVVWVYALEDSSASLGDWRAMAVWVDPRLPEQKRPSTARLGPNALTVGSVQYDFRNPSRERN